MKHSFIWRKFAVIDAEERHPLKQGLKPYYLRHKSLFLKSKVNKCEEERERHKGVLKQGLYKVFLDEIVPLSLFCIKHYPYNYRIAPIIGNKCYDAIAKDIYENIVDN